MIDHRNRWITRLQALEHWDISRAHIEWPDGVMATQPTDLTWQQWWTPIIGPVPCVVLGHLHYLTIHPHRAGRLTTTAHLADHLTPATDPMASDSYPTTRLLGAVTTLVLHRLVIVGEIRAGDGDRVLLPTPVPAPSAVMAAHIDNLLTQSAQTKAEQS